MSDSQERLANTPTTENSDRETVVVVGKASVGKSELVSSLTGDRPASGNFRGTTTRSKWYTTDGCKFVDTPGIVLDADTEGTRDALAQVGDDETVLLVVPATDIDDNLDALLPLVGSHLGAVVITFWDKVESRSVTLTSDGSAATSCTSSRRTTLGNEDPRRYERLHRQLD